MNRKTAILSVAALMALFAYAGSSEINSGKPYNVLIVHTDEHNFRTLGCYRRALPEKEALMWGRPVVETPYIDSIADRGLVADSFYCASPVCSPSRGSFVSGLYPNSTGVIENDTRIRQDIETFATALKSAGYATGYAGKWHLDGDKAEVVRIMSKKSGETARNIYSFPEYYSGWVPPKRGMGFTDNRFMFDTGHFKKIVSNPDGGYPEVFSPQIVGDEKTFATDWLADRAVEFIEQHKAEPFCYMVSFPDPHGPDLVREPYRSMYENAPFKTPYTARKDPKAAPAWAKVTGKKANDARYFGMVKCIDDNVGKILKKLSNLGLTDRTIVVFTADHGDLRGEHGRQDKGVPYEASAKIPFVIAAPDLIPAGTRTGLTLSTIDFKPTLLGLLGVPAEQSSEGRDASVVLRGGPVPKDWSNLIFLRSHGTGKTIDWLMATDGRYKLVAGVSDPLWLIDLKNDPTEQINYAGNPEMEPIVRSMSAALLTHAVKYDDPNLKSGSLRKSLKEGASK